MRPHRSNNLDLGQVASTGQSLVLSAEARSMHLHVCGGTGVGKSKFMEHLLRQDILAWPRTKCGLLLLDPHGSLYDNLMAWLAQYGLKRPIIPIDLRRADWIPSYNLLRRRTVATPAVVIDGIVDAMAHVWGQSGTDSTPLFARWAANVLHALYEKGHTLVEAIPLLDDLGVRRRITSDLKDRMSKRDWRVAAGLTAKEFEAQMGSTINRLQRFVRNDQLRAILGQAEVSLDLSEALEQGHIILVTMAREKAQISKENSSLFGTLLLNDLWTAAQERGKPRDARDIKPFYVYVDEFQRFITPTLAESLDEARGFGLHLTMAHQFPKQLRDEGDNGRRLYNSVMENAATKVVFRLTDEENLRPLAQWLFMGTMDPEQVKLKLHSTKVVGYREEERTSTTETRSATRGGGHSSGRGSGSGTSVPIDPPDDLDYAPGSESEHESENEGDNEFWTEGESSSTSTTTVLIPQMGQELSHVQFASLDEQLFRAMSALFDQKQRHCVARIADRMWAPVALVTPSILGALARPERIERYTEALFRRWPFFLPMAEANKRLANREKLVLEEGNEHEGAEPTTARRRRPPAS